MKLPIVRVAAVALACISAPNLAMSQAAKGPMGPVGSDLFHTDFVRTNKSGQGTFGLLYQPEKPGPNARVAIVYASPRALFDFTPAAEMASRGYTVLLVKHYLADRRRVRETTVDGLREVSPAITYMRALSGVERVVLMGHDDGGRMAAFYVAAAEQGAAVCKRPELIYPCPKSHAAAVVGLAKPDGVVMLDPSLGAADTMSAMDPAYEGSRRAKRDLDMYAAANGFNPRTGEGKYSADFVKRFFAAQSARNMLLVDQASAEIKLVEEGKGAYTDDAPFVIPGAINSGNTARLHDADLELLSSSRAPHTLLKADGTTAEGIVRSVRLPASVRKVAPLADCCGVVGFTARRFLDNDAIRTTPDFALTADNIVGVEWKSSLSSTPVSAESVTVPALVLTMSCSRAVVPGEIVFDHLATKDKSYVAVEGAGHDFAACKPEYGDTKKRTFDYLDGWLAQRGRF